MAMPNHALAAIDPAGVAARLGADGKGIVWAVIASGVDGGHPHFAKHRNLELGDGISHRDFTAEGAEEDEALIDPLEIGTHVSGIIAGTGVDAGSRDRAQIPGIAPLCRLLCLKVIDEEGSGD